LTARSSLHRCCAASGCSRLSAWCRGTHFSASTSTNARQKVAYLETTALNNRSVYVAAVKDLASSSAHLKPNPFMDSGPRR